jgi:hypothetical protein
MAASLVVAPARTPHHSARLGDNAFQGALAIDFPNGLLATSTNPTPASIGPFDTVNDRIVMVSADAAGWLSVGGTAGVATAGSMAIPVGVAQPIYVPAGLSISFIATSGTAHLSAIPCLLGTG